VRKLIFVCVVLVLSGVSCKKICACSPAQADLFLVVRNAVNKDLFNPSTLGHLTKDDVSLYTEGLNGQVNPVRFDLNPPMSDRVTDYQIRVSTIEAVLYKSPIVYLKLGSQNAPYTLDITISKDGRKIDRLLIDGKNIPANKKPDLSSLFYYSIK
jgi:hypothetical protein